MAMTGFDPSVVRMSILNVRSGYDTLIKAVKNDAQSKFVDAMVPLWACTDAQTFFNDKVKPAFDAIMKSAATTFESVMNAMNDAAAAWAAATDTPYEKVEFTPFTGELITSGIKENIDGVRGIDGAAATEVIAVLSDIQASAESGLDAAKSAVTNCGFVGGDQAANLSASLDSIKTNISNSVTELTTGANAAMEATIQAYGTIESNVSSAFVAGE